MKGGWCSQGKVLDGERPNSRRYKVEKSNLLFPSSPGHVWGAGKSVLSLPSGALEPCRQMLRWWEWTGSGLSWVLGSYSATDSEQPLGAALERP